MFNCSICNGNHFQRLLKIEAPDRFEKSVGISMVGYERSWVECLNCGAASNILPGESRKLLSKIRSSYYEVDFANSNIGEKYLKVMALPAGKSDNANRVNRVINFAANWFKSKKCLSVLDVGAGTGVFLSQLVKRTNGKWRYLGLEPDPIAAEHLRSLKKFNVFEGLYSSGASLTGFDVITLNKVLEHIEEPIDFLKEISKGLDPNCGLMYVEVPDKLSISLSPPEDNILGSMHCHLYDPASLTYLAGKVGLHVLDIKRIKEPSKKQTIYCFLTTHDALHRNGLPHE